MNKPELITDLTPNMVDINKHLAALFDPAFVHRYPDARIEIACGWPPTGGALNEARTFPAFDLEKAAKFAESKSKAGFNVYTVPVLRQGKHAGRATDTEFLASRVTWVDFDNAGDEQRIATILKNNNLRPALIVPTGLIPHRRAHLYFVVDTIVDPEQLKAANDSLRKLFDSDDVKSATHPMRLAGTINHPTPKKRERGYVTELVTLVADQQPQSYRADALIKLATADLSAPASDPFTDYGNKHSRHDESEIKALLDSVGGKGKWRKPMFPAVNKMIGHGWSDLQIRLACAPYCDGGADDPDLTKFIETGRKEFNKPDPGKHTAQVPTQDVENQKPLRAQWKKDLTKSPTGIAKPLLLNAALALSKAAEWDGVLAHNKFSRQTMVMKPPPWNADAKGWQERPWTAADDLMTNRWLQQQGIAVTLRVTEEAVELVAHEHGFHPVLEYLDSLVWDGEQRLDRWMIDYLGAADTKYTQRVARCALIAATARVRNPGCKVDTVPILEGLQGVGKSTAASALFAPWFTDDIADLGSKDAAMQLQGVWLVEIAELDAMARNDGSKIKAFLSRRTDRFRPPYGHRVGDFPRSSVIWGTTNSTGYLKDETGARRYWPIKCGKLDIDGLKKARDQLWAEADHLFKQGAKWWIVNANVLKEAEAEQDDRYQGDPWDEIISKRLQIRASVTVAEILTEQIGLPTERQGQAELNRVARILRSFGWERYRTRTGERLQWAYRRTAKAAPQVVEPTDDDQLAMAEAFIAYGTKVQRDGWLDSVTTL